MDNLEPITRNEMFLNGDDLEPITREEMILAGADLEPITRHEWFLKKYRGGGGGGGYDLVNVPNLPADIASFTDGTDLPMASLKVAVTPYQDLHGYDAPWAGGAGKNKLEVTATTQTINGVTFTVNSDGTVSLSGTATGTFAFPLISGTLSFTSDTIITGGYAEASASKVALRINGSNLVPSEGYTISANTNITEIAIRVNSGFNTNGVKLYPMIRLSSVTDSTFAPYSNICPIIGWDEATVGVSGINLFDKATIKDGYINDATGEVRESSLGAKCTDFTVVKANISYYIKTEQISGIWGAWYDKNKTYIRGITRYANSVITAPSNAFYVRLTIFYNNSGNIDTFGINYPSTDTSYHAYNGANYTIDLDGTRYGGVLDVLNGTMDDTLDYIASYNGETLPSTWISDRDVYAEGTTPTVGAEVVYTRATPITVQLAPTAVKSIEGENNISADCGQITEAKYFKKA